MVRRLKRKRLVREVSASAHLTGANQEWALDFVTDALATGRGIRILAIVDSFTRECPVLSVDTSLSGQHVTRALERVMEERGKPDRLRCDNGPEFTSRHFVGWCEEKGNTSFSAVGRLCDRGGEMTVTLFENVFSAVKIPYELLPPCFDSKRVNISDEPLVVP